MNRMRFLPTLSTYRPGTWTVVNHPTAQVEAHDYVPTADIAETEKAFTVWVALPGVKKDHVHLSVDKNELIITGKAEDRSAEGQTWRRQGIAAGQFRKVFTLSDGIDTEGITANLEDGLLWISLPKAPEAQKRNISIQ